MQALHVSLGIYPLSQAGTEIYTAELAEELIRQGHSVTVAIPATAETSRAAAAGSLPPYAVPIRRAPPGRLGNKLRYAKLQPALWKTELRALIEKTRPEIIHVQHAIGFGVPLLQFLEGFRIPLVVTLPDYWLLCPGILRECKGNVARCARVCCADAPWAGVGYFGRLAYAMSHRRRIRRFLARARPRLAAISPKTQSIFESEGVRKESIHVHPWGIDVGSLREMSCGGDVRPQARIGYIGSMRSHKGCHVLAQAFAGSRPIDASLHFHGGGDNAYLESLEREFAGHDVVFHGKFNHGSVAEILANLDVVVIPSIWEESYCLVVQEALAARKVVIASNIGGLGDRIVQGVNGFLVPPGDAAALSRELSSVVPRLKELTAQMDFDLGLLDIGEDARRWTSVYREAIDHASY